MASTFSSHSQLEASLVVNMKASDLDLGYLELNILHWCYAVHLETHAANAKRYIKSRLTNSSRKALPNMAGLLSTFTPADSNAEIFESAPPLPPLTIAPA